MLTCFDSSISCTSSFAHCTKEWFIRFLRASIPRASPSMPDYSTRTFLALMSVSISVALLLLAVAPIAINQVFPTTRAYYQLTNFENCIEICTPASTRWVSINHTLIIKGNVVESFLEATAVEEPIPNPTNISIGIWFNTVGYDPPLLHPTVTGGDTEWRGELHQNGSVTMHTSFVLPSDARYFIGGVASSSTNSTTDGRTTLFYLKVRSGQVVSISDSAFTDSTDSIMAKCLANC